MKLTVSVIVFMVAFGPVTRGQPQLDLVNATNEFAQRLYQKIGLDKENVLFSPHRIHSSLTMAYLGARNDTASEMSGVLCLGSFSGPAAHNSYGDLIQQLNSAEDVDIPSVNILLVRPNISIEQNYKNEAESKYDAQVANFNISAFENPEKEINKYVEEKTAGAIKNILPEGSIDNTTSIILITTLSFKGTWQDPFDSSKTRRQDFNHLNGSKSKVDMMNDTRSILFKRDNDTGVDVAQLPFKGGRFYLYIAVPHKNRSIADLEKQLATPGKVTSLLESLIPTLVELAIPKFKCKSTLHLKSSLRDMGMVKAFAPNEADFRGINKDGNLHLSRVVHKSVLEIQESGTVAAGGIAVEPAVSSDEKFIANRPFMFFLRDNQTKQILLQGKYSGK